MGEINLETLLQAIMRESVQPEQVEKQYMTILPNVSSDEIYGIARDFLNKHLGKDDNIFTMPPSAVADVMHFLRDENIYNHFRQTVNIGFEIKKIFVEYRPFAVDFRVNDIFAHDLFEGKKYTGKVDKHIHLKSFDWSRYHLLDKSHVIPTGIFVQKQLNKFQEGFPEKNPFVRPPIYQPKNPSKMHYCYFPLWNVVVESKKKSYFKKLKGKEYVLGMGSSIGGLLVYDGFKGQMLEQTVLGSESGDVSFHRQIRTSDDYYKFQERLSWAGAVIGGLAAGAGCLAAAMPKFMNDPSIEKGMLVFVGGVFFLVPGVLIGAIAKPVAGFFAEMYCNLTGFSKGEYQLISDDIARSIRKTR